MHSDFIAYGRMLFEQGLNNSHSGNMSRRAGKNIFITRHGARLGSLSPGDIVRVNAANTLKDREASLEVRVHRAVYRGCPAIDAIAHAHTPHGIVLSLKEKVIRPVDDEGRYYLPEIPVLCCRKTIASEDVASRLPALLKRYKAVLVRGHGAFAGGRTLEEAALYLSVLESACRVVFLSRLR